MKVRKYDVTAHYTMAICGGFLGAYAMITRLNLFGSAQTGNLISVISDLAGKNFRDMVLRIGGFLIYILAIILETILEKKTKWNVKYISIGIHFCMSILLSLFPTDMDPIIGLYPIFFMTAFQWCAFKGAKGYVSSTIFSTNNLRQTFSAWTEYYLIDKSNEKEKKEKAVKAKFFGGTIISFHVGVLLGYLIVPSIGIESILLCVPLLIVVLGVLLADDNVIRRYIILRKMSVPFKEH